MGTATINISISEAIEREVEEIVASEGYGNTSEFFSRFGARLHALTAGTQASQLCFWKGSKAAKRCREGRFRSDQAARARTA